jgi:hypothetical protein
VDVAITDISRSGTTVTLTIAGTPNTAYICRSSITLDGFAEVATTPSTVMTDGNGDATFSVDGSETSRFYLVEDAP